MTEREILFEDIAMTAVTDTCAALLTYPYGLQGDTGIREYLYAQLQHHGGEHLVVDDPRPGFSTLLLQAEHYTAARYSRSGSGSQGARFDLALAVTPGFDDDVADRCAENLDAVIAFELGKNKDLAHVVDATMLTHTADTVTGTSDVSKLHRELAHHELRQGWALEFYDSRRQGPGAAAAIIRATYHLCGQAAFDKDRKLVVVFVAFLGDGEHHVSSNDETVQVALLEALAARGICAGSQLPSAPSRDQARRASPVEPREADADLFVRGQRIVEYNGKLCHLSCRGYSFALREFTGGGFVELLRGSGDRDKYLGLRDKVRVVDRAPSNRLDDLAFSGPYFASLTESPAEPVAPS
jgi:hypothetical protein